MPESLYNEILTMDSSTRLRKSRLCGDTEVVPPHHTNSDPTSQIASMSMDIVCRQSRAMMHPLGRHLDMNVLHRCDEFATSGAQRRFRVTPLQLPDQATAPYLRLSARSAWVMRRFICAGFALQRDPHHGLEYAAQKIPYVRGHGSGPPAPLQRRPDVADCFGSVGS